MILGTPLVLPASCHAALRLVFAVSTTPAPRLYTPASRRVSRESGGTTARDPVSCQLCSCQLLVHLLDAETEHKQYWSSLEGF